MKFCTKCGTQANDEQAFCPNCGTAFNAAYTPVVDTSDHTSEFTAEDISDNKVLAMLPYLLGIAGLVISLLAIGESKYVAFHIRQGLKLVVTSALISIISGLLVWTIIAPVAGAVCMVIIFVLKIIAFFQVCDGKAKEPAIIKNLKFLK